MMSPRTNPAEYVRILSDSDNARRLCLEHFPSKIPEDAKNVKFSFFPGFLQGGPYIQLRYATTREKINKLYEQFSKLKIKSSCDKNRVSINFLTSGSDDISFPEDYEIMIFEEKEGRYSQFYGVAISKKRNEIVYWAESWV